MMKERSGHTVIHSGREDNQHTEGVAIIMSDKVANALMEWKPLGERLVMARFNSKYTKLTVITCYAPIEDAEEAKKDVFYDQLQQAIQEVASHGVLWWLEISTLALGTTMMAVIRSWGITGVVTGTTTDADSATCAWRTAWPLVEPYSRTEKSTR